MDINDFANGLLTNQEVKATALINAVNEAVVFKVDGPFSFNTSGLSIYFPYRDKENYDSNVELYGKTGFSPIYQEFLKKFKTTMETQEAQGPISYEVYEPTEDNPFFELVLDQNGLEKVYYVYIDLYTNAMIPTELEHDLQYLGYDFLVNYNEETQSYFEDFTFNWTFLGSEPLMMFVTHDYGDVVEYESPVIYNDEYMNLIYAWVTEFSETGEDLSRYEVYGLRRMIDPETGMPDKNLYQIEVGSVISPVYNMYDIETDRFDEIQGYPIIVTPTTNLEFKELPTTDYMMQFRLTDFAFNHLLTDFYFFTK